jgi:hypothetical protein
MNQKDKLLIGRGYFEVEKMLGRVIKQYNLLVMNKKGNTFYSSSKRTDKKILDAIVSADKRASPSTDPRMDWGVGWLVKSKMYEEQNLQDTQFFCVLCLVDRIVPAKATPLNKEVKFEKTDFMIWGASMVNDSELGIKTHFCPKCSKDYKLIHQTKEEADETKNNTSIEQHLSGICSNECWESCSPQEIVQFKFISPLSGHPSCVSVM